ncbi:hypothetical protein [Brevibacillus laterosporus]|uniref:hypothetical protein n=1 Tax=Brevibacillus laterosporus TaxID=1465 RepID=UPI003D22F68D
MIDQEKTIEHPLIYRLLGNLLCLVLGVWSLLICYFIFIDSQPPYVSPVERIGKAVTSHFGTENWILENDVSRYKEEPYYLISTNDGSYKVVLNADNTKVIKAVKAVE